MREFFRVNGDGAIDLAVPLDVEVESVIEEFRLALNTAGAVTEDLEITRIAPDLGHTLLMFSQDMDGTQYIHWIPTRPIAMAPGDSLHIEWANSAPTREWGLEVVYSRVVD